jgi:Leucine-rich repeat (LRR) protein
LGGSLPKLQYLGVRANELLSIGPSITELTNLVRGGVRLISLTLLIRDPSLPSLSRLLQQTFRCGNNDLDSADISPELYKLPDLTTLDLSSNRIDVIAEAMAEADNLLGIPSLGRGPRRACWCLAVLMCVSPAPPPQF